MPFHTVEKIKFLMFNNLHVNVTQDFNWEANHVFLLPDVDKTKSWLEEDVNVLQDFNVEEEAAYQYLNALPLKF